MNDDNYPYIPQENSSTMNMQNCREAPLNNGDMNLEQLDEVPISVPTVSPETSEQTSQILTPNNPSEKHKYIKKNLEMALKCLKRNLMRMFKINFACYCGLNIFLVILLRYAIINVFVFLIFWFLLSVWFICYKARHFLRNNNLFYDLFRMRNIQDLEQNPMNALIPNPNNPIPQPNSQNLQSNNDVLRRRDVDNLVAFHPLRFHMIVGRLHNILNQLRENQMIINAAVMGNNREGGFNFRDFHDLLINGGLNRNLPQSNGFSDQEIENLPQFTFEGSNEVKKPEDEEQCSICLMEFQNGEVIRTLPCIHNFHKDCINQWLKRQKYCPLCKGEIVFN